MFCRCLEPAPSRGTGEKRRLAVPAGACKPCIHISAAEVLALRELLAARHEKSSLLRCAGKSKHHREVPLKKVYQVGKCVREIKIVFVELVVFAPVTVE